MPKGDCMLQAFVEQLTKDMGAGQQPVMNAEGGYTLLFAPEITVLLSEEGGHIRLFSELAPCGQEELIVDLMKANLLGKETGEGFLGLSDDGKRVTFTCFLPSEMSYREQREMLEDFINYAESWRLEMVKGTE